MRGREGEQGEEVLRIRVKGAKEERIGQEVENVGRRVE